VAKFGNKFKKLKGYYILFIAVKMEGEGLDDLIEDIEELEEAIEEEGADDQDIPEDEADEDPIEASDTESEEETTMITTDVEPLEHRVRVIKRGRERITTPIMSKYEFAKIAGIRAAELEANLMPLIDPMKYGPYDNNTFYLRIAEQEIHKKLLPYIIRRPMPDGSVEEFTLQEMEIIGKF
jgi:DNA-directed RNA polymerase I, II, and III subunit RPABC2